MKTTFRLALTLAFAVATTSCVEAADISNFMESFTGNSTGWQEFDRDKASLATAINSAQTSGQLSKQQADEFRLQIQTLDQQEAQVRARGGLMSFVQSIAFNKQLNALAAQVETAISQGKVTTAAAPDSSKLLADLKARTDAMVKSNKLNETDATAIRQQLSHIDSMETAFRAESNGALSQRQTELLLVEINKVKSRLDQEDELADSGVRTLEFRRQGLEKKITDALSQSRLSQADAQNFRGELTRIEGRQKAFLTQAPKLTGSQLLELAGELDTVGTNLDAKLALSAAPSTVPAQVPAGDDFLDQFRRLDNRITRLLNTGRLSQQDADQARRDIDQLMEQYLAFKKVNPVLSPGQISKLDGDLDVLARHVNEIRRPYDMAYTGGRAPGREGGLDARGDGSRDVRGPGRDGFGRDGRGDFGSLDGGGASRDGFGRDARRDGSFGRLGPDNVDGRSNGRGDINTNERIERRDGGQSNERERTQQNPPAQHHPASGLSFPIIANKEFTDISGYWAQPYISQLANRGVIGGFPNGTFRPEANITRAQFAAIAAQALKLPMGAGANFTDVKPTYWAGPAIGAAANAGLIGGFPDGTFKPEENLTRAQALVILSKALKEAHADPAALSAFSDAQAVPGWANQSVTQAATAHIIVSFPDPNQIRPNALTTRGEVAGLMYQTLFALGVDLPRINIGLSEAN